jgi:hypothetical protein
MATRRCAVCDFCGKHEPLPEDYFDGAPENWLARFTRSLRDTRIYCSVACVEGALAEDEVYV